MYLWHSVLCQAAISVSILTLWICHAEIADHLLGCQYSYNKLVLLISICAIYYQKEVWFCIRVLEYSLHPQNRNISLLKISTPVIHFQSNVAQLFNDVSN